MFICQFVPTPCECVCELVRANVCGSSIFVFGKLNLHNEMENGIHILWREAKRKEQNRKEKKLTDVQDVDSEVSEQNSSHE